MTTSSHPVVERVSDHVSDDSLVVATAVVVALPAAWLVATAFPGGSDVWVPAALAVSGAPVALFRSDRARGWSQPRLVAVTAVVAAGTAALFGAALAVLSGPVALPAAAAVSFVVAYVGVGVALPSLS